MGRVYAVTFENVSISAVQDFFEVNPASNKPVRLHGIMLGQFSDVGDAQEELLRISIMRLLPTVTSGSGGSTPTPVPIDPNDATASFTAETNNTTVATTTGNTETILTYPFNIRTGLELFLPPELQPSVINGQLLVVRLLAAPTDAVSMSGTLFIEEIG